MRKAFITLLSAICLCILVGCGADSVDVSEELENNEIVSETVSDNEYKEDKEMTEEELHKFASGAESKEEEIETTNNNEAYVIDASVEEKCPYFASAPRADVKYGSYSFGEYYSETCGMNRKYGILLPADYSEDKQYPVLYLLHGIFGNEKTFAEDSGNKIKEIVANLAADGIIEETIVVTPNIYAKKDPELKPGFDEKSIAPYDDFCHDLINDLMPYIQENYSVKTGRENTYLAGFSMGGRETLYTSYMYPDYFAYVCAISSAPGLVPAKDWAMNHVGSITEDEFKYSEDAIRPDVLILCCGTKDSVVGKFPLSYHEILEKNGVEHIWYEIEGADHDNNAIKSGLFNLFKQISNAKQNVEE